MKRFSIYSSPIFLVPLGILILNDLYLKAAYSSWLTGKLSDFAGLIVVALLVFPLIRPRVHLGSATIGLVFAWWKSPLSQPLLDTWNKLGVLELARVVDYSDLVALFVLPVAIHVFTRHERAAVEPTPWRRLVFWPSLTLSLLAVAGTSAPVYNRAFAIRNSEPDTLVPAADFDEVLAAALAAEGFECRTHPDGAQGCGKEGIYVLYTTMSGQVSFEIQGHATGFLLGGNLKRAERDVEGFIRTLRTVFSSQFEGLEYVERLERTP